MDKDDILKNLLSGTEHSRANRIAKYKELAQGFCVMVNEFVQNGMDNQTAIAVALELVKTIVGTNK